MSQETGAPSRVKLPGADKGGQWVQMGDLLYKVAPLNFKALRELGPSINVLSKLETGTMPSAEQMGILVKLAHASLKRNYPDMEESLVDDNLDFSNFGSVLSAVMGAAGLKDRETPPSGETQPT